MKYFILGTEKIILRKINCVFLLIRLSPKREQASVFTNNKVKADIIQNSFIPDQKVMMA